MKRKSGIFAYVLLLVWTIGLAGCGSADAERTGSGVPTPNSAATASADRTGGGSSSPESAAASRRIVLTTVAVTQMMDALGIELVGVPTSAKTLPTRYDGVAKVGNPMSPDMELVKSLRPTDVLSVTTLRYDLEPVFEQAGLNATFLDLTSLADMQEAIRGLGAKFGREAEALVLADGFDETLARLQQAASGKTKPTVLILLGVPGSYLVATEHSYIGDLVRLLGGANIVQGEKVEYLASNTEYLQQADPDVILRAAHGMPDEVIEMFDAEFKKNDIWKHFQAVQNGRVYDLEEELFGTTGNLAAKEALEALYAKLYP